MRDLLDKMLIAALAALALLAVASAALARSSPSFDQSWHALTSGGAPAQSADFAADGSVGQWAGGVAEGATYRVEGGYWYGVAGRDHAQRPVGGTLVARAWYASGWLRVGLGALAGLALLVAAAIGRRLR